MNDNEPSDRWQQMSRICADALAREAAERAAFLQEACVGDDALRRDVESLLANESQAADFLTAPPAAAAKLLTSEQEFLIGKQIGPYRVLSLLGAGGMGEVYRARDTKLGRDVAIKVLPPMFTADRDRLARFEREARMLATLNHPHIGAIYGLEDADGVRALVLEFVDGETLAEKLAGSKLPASGSRHDQARSPTSEVRSPLSVSEAIAIARQIAEALEAAHEKGIIHRDLKPANIKITLDGSVKVLDFGLAKAATGDGSGPDLSQSPTITVGGTHDGVILGTAAYMSPEQARGSFVDKRTDIWAFGCVLYETLTGHPAFARDTVSDTVAAILERAPDWTALPAATPPAIRRLLARCLDKDRKERAPDIGLARLEIKEALAAPGVGVTASQAAPRPVWSRALPWIVAGVLGVALVAVLLVWSPWRSTSAFDTPVARLSMAPPEKNRFNRATPPAVSPNGRYVVFSATSEDEKTQLWLRPFDSPTAQPLAGTENAIYPFWSPDSKSIGFFGGGKLKKMNLSGGPATTLADASQGRGGTWSPNGVIVFAPTIYSGLYQVATSGGVVSRASRFDIGTPPQKFPWFLPDGRHFCYLFGAGGRDQRTIRIGSLDSPAEDRTLLAGVDSSAMYAQGHVLFVRGTTLVARPFDATRLAFTGEEVPVAEHLLTKGIPLQSWVFSVSANGVLAYESAGETALQLTWLDRAGTRLGTVGDPGDFGDGVRVSPDRRTATVTVDNASSGNTDIWLYDLLRGLPTRFTFGPAPHGSPVWSPDGHILVFPSNQTGRFDLYRKPADGSGNEELLYADNLLKDPTSFSPDGAHLAYWVAGDPKTGDDIWILPGPLGAPGVSKPYPFMRTEFNEQDPEFSPDGRWIAFRSNESGRYEVYVAPFPASGGKRQVSTAGGARPRWRADGKELFYDAADNRLMAAEVETKGGVFEVKKVEPLFGPIGGSYDVSVDGQRFLTLVPVGGETDTLLTVVQNWAAGIKSGK